MLGGYCFCSGLRGGMVAPNDFRSKHKYEVYVFGNGPNKNTHMYSVPQIVLLRDCLFHELEAVPKPERYNGRYFSLIHPPTHSEKEITPPLWASA